VVRIVLRARVNVYPQKASQVFINIIHILLPPCKTILLRALNIIQDSRLDSSFILFSLCVLTRLHTPHAILATHPLLPVSHISHPLSITSSLPLFAASSPIYCSLSHSIYLFNGIIIHNCSSSTYYYYAIYICNPLTFCRFPYPASAYMCV